ncbi:hypothetical protein BJF78_07370 [Pseudonocardia sp. CNS-139]|nr:hypothetical protein BJF78_07370 [Pseudonocardia sp. CNS-139]
MPDLPTIALAIVTGVQTGLIFAWRYYKRQRDDQDVVRRQYEARISLLEHDLERERLERRRVEGDMRAITWRQNRDHS